MPTNYPSSLGAPTLESGGLDPLVLANQQRKEEVDQKRLDAKAFEDSLDMGQSGTILPQHLPGVYEAKDAYIGGVGDILARNGGKMPQVGSQDWQQIQKAKSGFKTYLQSGKQVADEHKQFLSTTGANKQNFHNWEDVNQWYQLPIHSSDPNVKTMANTPRPELYQRGDIYGTAAASLKKRGLDKTKTAGPNADKTLLYETLKEVQSPKSARAAFAGALSSDPYEVKKWTAEFQSLPPEKKNEYAQMAQQFGTTPDFEYAYNEKGGKTLEIDNTITDVGNMSQPGGAGGLNSPEAAKLWVDAFDQTNPGKQDWSNFQETGLVVNPNGQVESKETVDLTTLAPGASGPGQSENWQEIKATNLGEGVTIGFEQDDEGKNIPIKSSQMVWSEDGSKYSFIPENGYDENGNIRVDAIDWKPRSNYRVDVSKLIQMNPRMPTMAAFEKLLKERGHYQEKTTATKQQTKTAGNANAGEDKTFNLSDLRAKYPDVKDEDLIEHYGKAGYKVIINQ